MPRARSIDKDDRLFTVNDVAERWQVHHRTVRREVERRRLNPTRVGGLIRFSEEEILRYERGA
jgi:excisionase family DNA binding protein